MPKPILHITCEAKNKKAVVKIEGYISGWEAHAAKFKASVEDLVAKGITDMQVYINSPGGSCFEANEIGNVLDKFTGSKTAELGALCASAATYIACKCDKVIASVNTSYMVHKPHVMVAGNADEIDAQVKQLRNLQKHYASVYTKRTGIKAEELEAMWKEDYWMDAEEAKQKGFVDEINTNTAELSVDVIESLKELKYQHVPVLAATTPPPTQHKPTNDDKMKNLALFAALFGMAIKEGTTEEHVLEGFKAHLKGLNDKNAELTAQLETANKELGKVKTANIEALLDGCKRKLTDDERTKFRALAEKDFESTKFAIDMIGPHATIADQLNKSKGGQTANPFEGKTLSELMSSKEGSDYLAKIKAGSAEEFAEYERLFEAQYGKKPSKG